MTWAVAGVLRPRESLQVALTVMGPAGAPEVFNDALLPLPETLPPVALQPATVTEALSGLLQVQLMVAEAPVCTVDGLAEHEMAGGFLGGSFTAKDAMQLAWPAVCALGSEMLAVTV